MGLVATQWQDLSLRELELAYESYVIERWSPYADLMCLIYENTRVLIAVNGNKSPPQKTSKDFHPFFAGEKRVQGLLTPENFKQIAKSILRAIR